MRLNYVTLTELDELIREYIYSKETQPKFYKINDALVNIETKTFLTKEYGTCNGLSIEIIKIS